MTSSVTDTGDQPSKRLVIVSYEFPPVQGPGVWRALGWSRYLPEFGWKVTVVASDRSHWHDRTDPSLLPLIPATTTVARIRGVPFGTYLQRFLPSAVVGYLRRRLPDPLAIPTLKLLVRALGEMKSGEECCLLTSGPPHVVHLVGLVLKTLKRCTWIVDYRDLWMDDPAMAWRGGYQRRLGLYLENVVLTRADLVMTVAPRWRRSLAARRPGRKTILIRNASDLMISNGCQCERPWPAGERVLLFPGTPQPNNSLDGLWEGIDQFLKTPEGQDGSTRFAFMGLGPNAHEEIRARGIASAVEDLGPQPLTRAISLMRGADGILVPVRRGPVSSGTIPAKLYDAIALSKFILLIAEPEGDAAALLKGYPDHTICAADDPVLLAKAFAEFTRWRSENSQIARAPVLPPDWSRRSAALELSEALKRFRAPPAAPPLD